MSDPTDRAPGAKPAGNRNSATQPIPILGDLAHLPPPEPPAEQQTTALVLVPASAPTPTAAPTPTPAPAAASVRPGRLRRLGPWIGGAIAVLLLAGAAISYLRERPAAGPVETAAAKEPPPPLRAYYDRANNGDVSAMRMLGTMYYNGLNVTQDTKEGIRWYRKAAKAGSVAAAKDLEQLGLTPAE